MALLARAALIVGVGLVLAFVWLRPVVVAEQRWQALRQRGALRIGIDPGVRPFSFYDRQGWAGLDATVAREIAARLNLRLEPIPVGYDGFYDALATQQADVIMSALVADPAKTAEFAYSRPYFDGGLWLVISGRADTPRLRSGASVDLRGRCVAVARGSEADRLARWLERRTPGMTRRVVQDDRAALAEIRIGNCEGALVEWRAALEAGCTMNSPSPSPADGMPNLARGYACLSLRPRAFVIAATRDNSRLLAEINAALDAMAADGTLDAITRSTAMPQ